MREMNWSRGRRICPRRAGTFALVVVMSTSIVFPATVAAAKGDGPSQSRDATVAQPTLGRGPQVGECTKTSAWGPFVLDGGVVDCSDPHTGQTVYVGKWTSRTSPAETDTFSFRKRDKVVDQLMPEIDRCDAARHDFLGAWRSPSVFRISKFYVHVSGPNQKEWAAGERWLRCDVVAFEAPRSWSQTANNWLQLPTKLQFLPAPSQLRAYLSKPDLRRFTGCMAPRNGVGPYDLFSCRDGIETVAGIDLPKTFSSTDKARAYVEKRCVGVVKDLTGKTVARSGIRALSVGCAASATSWVCGIRRD